MSYHGRHHPADVYGAASIQVVLSSVLLVLGADLEQIQAGLQNAGLVLNTRWETKVEVRILDVMLTNDPWLTCAQVAMMAYLSMRVSSLLPCALLKHSLEQKMNWKRLCCHLRFDEPSQNHLLMNTVSQFFPAFYWHVVNLKLIPKHILTVPIAPVPDQKTTVSTQDSSVTPWTTTRSHSERTPPSGPQKGWTLYPLQE